VITPRDIGLLSALGIDEVPVRAKPRVGIVSTGDELVRPGEKLHSERGEIYDVNSYTIAAGSKMRAARRSSTPTPATNKRRWSDSSERGRRVRPRALLGSTSASAVDVIYRVIEEQGELLLHGVSVKPGKPMLIGRLEDSAYVGLPGYPVSAMMVFERSSHRRSVRLACRSPHPQRFPAGSPGKSGTRKAVIGSCPSGWLMTCRRTLVYPVDKGSGATTSLADADGVVEVGPETDYLEAGEPVTVTLFSPDVRPPTLFGVGEGDPTVARLLDGLDNPAISPSESPARSPATPRARPRRGRGRRGCSRMRGGDSRRRARQRARERRDRTGPLGVGLVVQPGTPTRSRDSRTRSIAICASSIGRRFRTVLESGCCDRQPRRGSGERIATKIVDAIDGFDLDCAPTRAPPRKVIASDADAGLGLRETADRLDLGFVPVGEQPVRGPREPRSDGEGWGSGARGGARRRLVGAAIAARRQPTP